MKAAPGADEDRDARTSKQAEKASDPFGAPPPTFEAALLEVGLEAKRIGLDESLAVIGVGREWRDEWRKHYPGKLAEQYAEAFGYGLLLGLHTAVEGSQLSTLLREFRSVRPFLAYNRLGGDPPEPATWDFDRSEKVPGMSIGGADYIAEFLTRPDDKPQEQTRKLRRKDAEELDPSLFAFLVGARVGHELRRGDRRIVVPPERPPRLPAAWLLTCGFDPDQRFPNYKRYEQVRFAVHIAARSSQVNGELPWWPMLSEVRPGDLVLLSLSEFEPRTVLSTTARGDLLAEASSYSNPSGPLLTEERPAFEPRADGKLGGRLFGIGLIRAFPHWDEGHWRVPVTSIVPFPEEFDADKLRRVHPAFTKLAPAACEPLSHNQFSPSCCWIPPQAWSALRQWLIGTWPDNPWLHDSLDRLAHCSEQLVLGAAPESIDALAPHWDPGDNGAALVHPDQRRDLQRQRLKEQRAAASKSRPVSEKARLKLLGGDPSELVEPRRIPFDRRASGRRCLTWRWCSGWREWNPVPTELEESSINLGKHVGTVVQQLRETRNELAKTRSSGKQPMYVTFLPLVIARELDAELTRTSLAEELTGRAASGPRRDRLGSAVRRVLLPADPCWVSLRPAWMLVCKSDDFDTPYAWWIIGIGDQRPDTEIDALSTPLTQRRRSRRASLLGVGPRRPVGQVGGAVADELKERLRAILADRVAAMPERGQLKPTEFGDPPEEAPDELRALWRGITLVLAGEPPWRSWREYGAGDA